MPGEAEIRELWRLFGVVEYEAVRKIQNEHPEINVDPESENFPEVVRQLAPDYDKVLTKIASLTVRIMYEASPISRARPPQSTKK